MKHYSHLGLSLLVFLICLTSLGGEQQEKSNAISDKSPSVVKAWETPKDLRVPESVIYDDHNGLIYVTSINGSPLDKNDLGFISALDMSGKILKTKWAKGFHAPKGMGIINDLLYVTDIDQVHAVLLFNGNIFKTWRVEGAKFLNDIAVDENETVYISDSVTQTIHMLKDGKTAPFLKLNYKNLNGLYLDKDSLMVGTAEGLVKIHIPSKMVSLEIKHSGGIDGLKPIGQGRYLVSDWQGKTRIIEKGKDPIVLIDTTDQRINAADFEYISHLKRILIPTFFDNRVMAYTLVL